MCMNNYLKIVLLQVYNFVLDSVQQHFTRDHSIYTYINLLLVIVYYNMSTKKSCFKNICLIKVLIKHVLIMILTYNVLPNQKDDPSTPNGLIKRF